MHTLKVPQETKSKGAFLCHCGCGKKEQRLKQDFRSLSQEKHPFRQGDMETRVLRSDPGVYDLQGRVNPLGTSWGF